MWTSVATANLTYTKVTTSATRLYDDTSVSFDDSNTYYDGGNPNMWSSIASSVTAWTSIQS